MTTTPKTTPKSTPKTTPKSEAKSEALQPPTAAVAAVSIEKEAPVQRAPQVGQPERFDQAGQREDRGQQEAVHGQQQMPHIAAGARVTMGVDSEGTPEGDRAASRRWDKVKGMAKQSWSQLTAADFALAEGSIEKLYDVIHKKVGGAREAVKTRLDKLLG